MKISYRWLKDYVDIRVKPDELAHMLTMAGLEVESVDRIGEIPDGVVVGKVLRVDRHPDADRLTVCSVDVGLAEPLQIVCGAPNVAEGQKVPVAQVGCTLRMPDQKNDGTFVALDVRKAKIRGVASEGMICAEDEIGLSEDHSGIMVVAEDAPVGAAFAIYLESLGRVSDAVLDIAVTPNRPDATSHLGVARDVAALTEEKLQIPDVDVPVTEGDAAKNIRVTIENEQLCRRYAAIVVMGVTIKGSPDWLKQRLAAIGLRPRNNVVDVTNYVMYECGQPLHAFDLDEIGGARIIVRPTAARSKFTTLDGIERELPAGTLMICDAEREVAIAGVMGGQNSEVSASTTNVLIESAYFSPASIRRTSKALGLQTDASYRFERGVDSAVQVWAAMRAAILMADLGGGVVVPGVVDAHPAPIEARSIDLRISRVAKILGIDVPKTDAVRLLDAIGFESSAGSGDVVTVKVPSHRPDVEREIDVIEEVARLYGYDRIEEPESAPVPSFTPRDRKDDLARQRVLSLTAGWGYREIYTNSLLSDERAKDYCDPVLLGDLRNGTPVATANAISQEMTTLRPSLLPGALEVIRHNLNHGRSSVRVIEFGHVFTRQDLPENIIPGFEEHESMLIACAGNARDRHWTAPDRELDFFDVKGAVSSILSTLGVIGVRENSVYEEAGATQYRIDYDSNGERLGTSGALNAARLTAEGIDVPVYFAEVNWSRLLAASSVGSNVAYRDVNRFPTVARDLAFVVDSAQDVGPILNTILEEGAPLLADVGVFDVYQGSNVGANRKSVAFWLHFAGARTLTDNEVDKQVDRIVVAVRNTFSAELRD